jgi:hypothetical protein
MSSTICQLLTTVAELQIHLKGLNDDQQEEEFKMEMRLGKMAHKEGTWDESV